MSSALLTPQGLPTNYTPLPPPPGIGQIVYLASALFKVRVGAQSTPPDTPNQYTADIGVMGDQGAMNMDAIRGPQGDPGMQTFAFRRQDDADVNSPQDLPDNLTNTPTDIGKYWLIDTVDNEGMVTMQTAWTWYGTEWRTLMHGMFGPPGPVPEITVSQTLIPEDQDAYVDTGGGTMQPSWGLMLPQPAGIPGKPTELYLFPDTDIPPTPDQYDVLAFLGHYNAIGEPIFTNFAIDAWLPQPYTMPEGSFVAYQGVSQQAAIGSYAVPPQPFDWTPIVWGHIGMGGASLSASPLMIGCQVLLGDPSKGTQVARGIGSTLGRVNIDPHYSTSQKKAQALSPINNYATVPKNHTGSQGTLYINLWNDGVLGAYNFNPPGAQLYVQAVPVDLMKQFAAGTRRVG